MKAQDISVAIMYPGGRIDRLADPLFASDMDVEIEPRDAYDRDIIMLDNAGPKMIHPILRASRDTKVIYRIRGDMLRAYIEMNNTTAKYHLAKYLIGKVDGAVSIESRLAKTFKEATGVSPIHNASLSKVVRKWPTVTHNREKLHCITLTNANYMGKVQPIIDYAPYVDSFFQMYDGNWKIYGRGKRLGYLKDCLVGYENIEVCGYTESPKKALVQSNLMLHLSSFDSLPNAILEGMACNLPVITNPYDVFENYGHPLVRVSQSEIWDVLMKATVPNWREQYGKYGMDKVKAFHSKERIARQYEKAFKSFLTGY